MKTQRAGSAGFTLIELMVVIGIISLLAVALLPRIVESREQANKTADEANLRWHYQNLLAFQTKYKGRLPSNGGSQFVLDPWVKGVCEHTPQNFERYWTPGINEPRKDELLAIGIDNIWKDIADVTSLDTHYAGRAKAHLVGKLMSGKEPLMANDNQFEAAFGDQTILVLMGDSSVQAINFIPDLQELGYTGDGKEEWFPVGPDSPHPWLQKLEH